MLSESHFDVIVVGGGIVGLATALSVQRCGFSNRVIVLEAERHVAAHQSGHNSGVLHSGIYYKPGSQKAITCRRGKKAMQDFCDEHAIVYDLCGKIVVATSQPELVQLDSIAERANANGVEFARIDTDELRRLEPSVAGLAGLHVPETGIVNYARVCEVMQQSISRNGGKVQLQTQVVQIKADTSSIEVRSKSGDVFHAARLINCGGLQSDRILKLAGGKPSVRIVPFRGEYYELISSSERLCRNLIYPVPDPAFPFLGVHFTRMIDGGVECGPNAVLALSRHGYDWKCVSPTDLIETLGYGGFRKLALKYWRTGLGEINRSLSKGAFVAALQKLIPSIRSSDLKPGRAGVRAQAVSSEGKLVDDFLIERTKNAVHVVNAPSPAATASIAIGETIVTDHLLP